MTQTFRTGTEPPLHQPYYGAPFGAAYARFWKKGVTFSGRASRAEYWKAYAATVLVAIALEVVSQTVDAAFLASGNFPPVGLSLLLLGLSSLYTLAWIVPLIAASVRRLHDGGSSGGFFFLMLVPIVGGIIVLVMLARAPNPAGARYDMAPASGPVPFFPQPSVSELPPVPPVPEAPPAFGADAEVGAWGHGMPPVPPPPAPPAFGADFGSPDAGVPTLLPIPAPPAPPASPVPSAAESLVAAPPRAGWVGPGPVVDTPAATAPAVAVDGPITGVPGLPAPSHDARVEAVAAPPAPARQPVAPQWEAPGPPVEDLDLTRAAAPAVGGTEDDDGATRMSAPRRTAAWIVDLPDGRSVAIAGAVYVGRAPVAAPEHPDAVLVPVQDPARSMSKTHACLVYDGRELRLTDLHSTNGTTVGVSGQPAVSLTPGVPCPVATDVTVAFGDYAVRVHPHID